VPEMALHAAITGYYNRSGVDDGSPIPIFAAK
jgi:hypothetical protein